jgi:hypothetical protein
MNAPGEAVAQEQVNFHHLLLRLAGKMPDSMVAQAREWLAAGRLDDAARAVAFTAAAQRVPLMEEDVALLDELLEAGDVDESTLADVEIAEYDAPPWFGFSAGRPDAPPPARASDVPLEDIDTVALAAATEASGVRGLWRAWRYPVDGSPWPPPRRVYLVEADEAVDMVALTDRIQRRLAGAGETEPQVETYPVDADLPAYQRLAIAYGALLWASTPEPDIRIASVFDDVDPETGPLFTDSHPQMEDADETERVIEYLNAGEPLLVTTAAMDDVVDRSGRNVVPMNFRTDGTWIWTDTTTYYLARHNLAPDPELLDHIRAADYSLPRLDGVAIHRAMAVLQEPPEEEPVWTYNGSGPDRSPEEDPGEEAEG